MHSGVFLGQSRKSYVFVRSHEDFDVRIVLQILVQVSAAVLLIGKRYVRIDLIERVLNLVKRLEITEKSCDLQRHGFLSVKLRGNPSEALSVLFPEQAVQPNAIADAAAADKILVISFFIAVHFLPVCTFCL